MRVLKTKPFARWARKENLADASLLEAVDETRRGLVDADLGGGLFKKRVARPGRGKSGGFRTLLAADLHERWVFLYGFAKNERDSVDEEELQGLKRLARIYLSMEENVVERLLKAEQLLEVKDGGSKAA